MLREEARFQSVAKVRSKGYGRSKLKAYALQGYQSYLHLEVASISSSVALLEVRISALKCVSVSASIMPVSLARSCSRYSVS